MAGGGPCEGATGGTGGALLSITAKYVKKGLCRELLFYAAKLNFSKTSVVAGKEKCIVEI